MFISILVITNNLLGVAVAVLELVRMYKNKKK